MAKITFGNGLQLKAELPKIGPAVVEKEIPEIDMESLLQKVISMLPKSEPVKETVIVQKEVDLNHLATKNEMASAVIEICKQRDQLEAKVEAISNRKIEMPEIKSITNIQDVSEDVRLEIKDVRDALKADLKEHGTHLISIESKLYKQKVINYILTGLVILTIFLHLK